MLAALFRLLKPEYWLNSVITIRLMCLLHSHNRHDWHQNILVHVKAITQYTDVQWRWIFWIRCLHDLKLWLIQEYALIQITQAEYLVITIKWISLHEAYTIGIWLTQFISTINAAVFLCLYLVKMCTHKVTMSGSFEKTSQDFCMTS